MFYILTHHTSSSSWIKGEGEGEEANASFWIILSRKIKFGFKLIFLEAPTKWTQQKDHAGYLKSNEKSLLSFLIQGENNFKVDVVIFVLSN